MRFALVIGLTTMSAAAAFAQDYAAPPALVPGLHRPLDELLDLYVRDEFVYYNAVKSDRGRLDQYIRALDGPAAVQQAKGSREEQLAFWINAYNAFVLQTVITHFPIRGRAGEYPAVSIRQVPGAFDRGAVGGGRLRSEAYDPKRLDAQLAAVAAESVTRREIVRVDTLNSQLSVTPLFSWREPVFVAALADKANAIFKTRSPLERAVLALIEPHLSGSEAEFLEKNTFKMVFHQFDWRLNDLSNRPN